MADRDQVLTVEVKAGRLIISVGVDNLMETVRAAEDWDDDLEIYDADVFAIEIADRLESEEGDDGLTDLRRAIDTAALLAIDNGSDAVRFRGEDDD